MLPSASASSEIANRFLKQASVWRAQTFHRNRVQLAVCCSAILKIGASSQVFLTWPTARGIVINHDDCRGNHAEKEIGRVIALFLCRFGDPRRQGTQVGPAQCAFEQL